MGRRPPIPLALIGLLLLGVPLAAQDLVRRPERVHKAWWIVASPALFPAVIAIDILGWGRFDGVVEAMPYMAHWLHIHLVALAALQLGMALFFAGSRGLRSTHWARGPLLALIPGVSLTAFGTLVQSVAWTALGAWVCAGAALASLTGAE